MISLAKNIDLRMVGLASGYRKSEGRQFTILWPCLLTQAVTSALNLRTPWHYLSDNPLSMLQVWYHHQHKLCPFVYQFFLVQFLPQLIIFVSRLSLLYLKCCFFLSLIEIKKKLLISENSSTSTSFKLKETHPKASISELWWIVLIKFQR